MTFRPELHGARSKFKRAKKHVEDFEAGFSAYMRDNRELVVREPQPTGGQKAKFVRPEPIPADLVCAVGDAIHNMRSALDHVAYAVAKWNGFSKHDLREVDFPVRVSKASFDRAIKQAKVARIGAPWVRFLEGIEPYHGGRGSDLFVISFLDNLDKHRDVISVHAFYDTFIWNGYGYDPVRSGVRVEDGIEIALDPSDPDYHTHHQTRVVIGERVPGLDPDAWAHNLLGRLNVAVWGAVYTADLTANLWP